MFVDTSVIVMAILLKEPDGPQFATRLAAAAVSYTSPLVVLEATIVVSTQMYMEPVKAELRVRRLLEEAGIVIIPITDEIGAASVDAFSRYGKGRGHPARLNLADCMSYACAKALGVALLFKGEDFARTDIEIA